jgi:hypothetical protein
MSLTQLYRVKYVCMSAPGRPKRPGRGAGGRSRCLALGAKRWTVDGSGGTDCAGIPHTPDCDARDGEGHTHWHACGEG